MSVIFAPPRVPVNASIEWHLTATAWLECCLEVFSRVDRSIDECIASLEGSGMDRVLDPHDQGQRVRGKALSQFLESERFSPHWRAAVEKLQAWDDKEIDRLWLANGILTVRPGEIELSLSIQDDKAAASPMTRTFHAIQMLAFLRELDEAQRALHSQLGQIRAAARKRL